MGKDWTVFIESQEVRHVIPLDDAGEHLDSSHDEDLPFGPCPACSCPCRPKRTFEGPVTIFIHSSFDGREGLEWANEILK
jgi:hypothetical protein